MTVKEMIKESEVLRKAYDFEVEILRTDGLAPNPWYAQVLDLENGNDIWLAILEAAEVEVNGPI